MKSGCRRSWGGGVTPAPYTYRERKGRIFRVGDERQWYSNKELYEMMMDFTSKVEKLGTELEKTQTMIRDYNGLRTRISECEKRLERSEGSHSGGNAMWGYVVGGLGVIFALISFAIGR